jgi:hypothetical protein
LKLISCVFCEEGTMNRIEYPADRCRGAAGPLPAVIYRCFRCERDASPNSLNVRLQLQSKSHFREAKMV